jgi:S1-C subfamily serine protease
MKKLLTLTLILLLLAGCHNKKSAEELFNETASGVVVVLNEFYYEIQLPNGESLYFKGLDANGDLTGLTPEAEEAKKNRNIITGTAFFIDKEGTLMTNRHVAQPNIDAVTARRSLIRLIKTLELLYSEKMAELSQQYDLLENQKSQCTYYDYDGFIHTDEARLVEINEQQERLGQQYAALEKSKDGLNANIDPEGIRIRIISELGIAYNNTYITSENDFIVKNPCVVVRTSDKEDIDLALIQLKNKKTPEDSHVFKLKGDNGSGSFIEKVAGLFANEEDDKLKIDQQLYMIGYNAGLILANTKQGIKVQMTSGKVTQLPDGQRLLYSIPTLQGSSGSPVIDEYGNLVAVNFAKLGTTDNFNFGIPEERIREFLRK